MVRGLSISIFTQRIALRIRTYSLGQRICFQIIEENTGFLRLASGWIVSSTEVILRPIPDRRASRKTAFSVIGILENLMTTTWFFALLQGIMHTGFTVCGAPVDTFS
jgi:hypothetical protein